MNRIRLAIVDDYALFRSGMGYIISEFENVELVTSVSNGQEFLDSLSTARELPDIVLMDLKMDKLDGMETTKILSRDYPSISVLVLSLYFSEAFVLRMIELGAAGYLPKNAEPEEVRHAIYKVNEKGFYYSDEVLRILRLSIQSRRKPKPTFSSITPLSSREKEVLKLICEQKTNIEIAEKLFISDRTVAGHRNHILEKTGARNTAGMVIYAIEHGIFDMTDSSREKLLDK